MPAATPSRSNGQCRVSVVCVLKSSGKNNFFVGYPRENEWYMTRKVHLLRHVMLNNDNGDAKDKRLVKFTFYFTVKKCVCWLKNY